MIINTMTASSCDEAMNILTKLRVPVVVSDQRMPDMPGSVFLAQVKKLYPKTVTMVISGYTDFDALIESVNKGEIYKFIPKPWDETYLIHALESAFANYYELEKKDRKNRALDNALESIIMTNLEDKIESVNSSFCLTTGYQEEEIVNTNVWKLFPEFKVDNNDQIQEQIKLQKVWQGDTLFLLICLDDLQFIAASHNMPHGKLYVGFLH